ncbi:MAG: caspase family protein [Kaiparowitsia implicata GSE-PSE-MK54-09C]|jgi:WD40 repeat protein/energy-coupling factor transporter ATP-binding protein EcfA2|nr:caspase family protein [Kaiparowitsia implicata GSE-PSE-MK54-09C]
MSRDALVVGINSYRYLSGLQAPARDAEAIAHLLQKQGDFRVQRLPEVIQSGHPQVGHSTLVSLRDLETALINLFKPRGNTIPQTALFYFSGHGIQRDAGINEGYLAVSDTQPDVGFYGLSLFWLRRLLQESPVRQRVVILDCCHSGELLNFLEADPGARAGTDRLFMAASREYEAAYESLEGTYSVFTQALVDGLDARQSGLDRVTGLALTAQVSQALQGELQQPLFESSGGEIVLTRCGKRAEPVLPKLPRRVDDCCPYRGLESFEEAHAEYFFGREEMTAKLVEKVAQSSFVTLMGASGSGKSSLLRAGLMHHLRQGKQIAGSDRWRLKLITPGEHPLHSLASAFVDPHLPNIERAEQLRRAEHFLRDGRLGLGQLVRATLAPETTITSGLGDRQRPRMVLVIDQFEELFSLCDDEEERQQFLSCVIAALESPDTSLCVVAGLRADFFSACVRYKNLARHLKRQIMPLLPLSYEQIKNTIVRPARKVGLKCEPNLVYTILLDVMGAPGELPLLQYALLELWQHRDISASGQPSTLTLNAYTELGGVRGTLQTRATALLQALPPEEQQMAKRIFLALTQLGDGSDDTRRRVAKSELMNTAFAPALIEDTLEKLVAAKLVVTNRTRGDEVTSIDGKETLDIAHEALIRHWPLLRTWLDESRTMLRQVRRVEQVAHEWLDSGKPMDAGHLLRGNRLTEAREVMCRYPQELSAVATHYVQMSWARLQRDRQRLNLLRFGIPSVMTAATAIALGQYHLAVQTYAEKDLQISHATSRERAAIAQSILQEPQADSMAALLISRLAAEQGGHTYEAQSSLRAALQRLGLQVQLKGHTAAITQAVFSADGYYLATGSADGTLALWTGMNQVIRVAQQMSPSQQLPWREKPGADEPATPPKIIGIAFSPSGEQVAAIAQGTSTVNVWDVKSGIVQFRLSLPEAATHLAYSSDGQWLVAAGGQSVRAWQPSTGQLRGQRVAPAPIQQFSLSPDGQALLLGHANATVDVVPLGSMRSEGEPTPLEPTVTLRSPAAIRQAFYSPGGQWVVVAADDGRVRLWDAQTGDPAHVLNHRTRFESLPIRDEADEAGDSKRPNPSGAQPSIATSPGALMQVHLSPDDQLVLTLDAEGQQKVWELETQTLVSESTKSTPGFTARPSAIALGADNQAASVVRLSPSSSQITLWDIRSGQTIAQFHDSQHVTLVAFSPDNAYVMTANQSGGVQLWANYPGGELPTVRLANGPIQWAGFLTTDALTPLREGVPLGSDRPPLPASTASTIATELNPAANRLLTLSSDGQVKRWTILADQLPKSTARAPDALDSTALHTGYLGESGRRSFHPEDLWLQLRTWLVSMADGATNAATEWRSPVIAAEEDQGASQSVDEPANGTSAIEFSTPTLAMANFPTAEWDMAQVQSLAISDDSQWLAIATLDQELVLQLQQPDGTYRVQHRLPLQSEGNSSSSLSGLTITSPEPLIFSPDSRQLLVVGEDAIGRLWDVDTGKQVGELRGHDDSIRNAQFSPDGHMIATASADGSVMVWERGSGRQRIKIPLGEAVTSVGFNATGTKLVAMLSTGEGHIADIETGVLQVSLKGHQGAVMDVAFSPDGQSIVTASTDGTVRLWSAQTGSEMALLRPHSTTATAIKHVFFSPDGQYVSALTHQGHLYLWAATWEMLLKLARDRSQRQLTLAECTRYLRLPAPSCPSLEMN